MPGVEHPEDADPFRFVVAAVFTITGRGLVAAGLIEGGVVRTGDVVEVVHGGQRRTARVAGVEMIDGRNIDLGTVGLLLPELSKEDVAEGDIIGTIQ